MVIGEEQPKNCCHLESQLVRPQSSVPPAQPIPWDLGRGDESRGTRAGNAMLSGG